MMTGVVLAGGRSRRMGWDKAKLAWEHGSLLSAAVDKLTVLCKEIVVVGPQRELSCDVRWAADKYVGAGPLAGLQAGLAAASFDSVLVLPCDMPFVPIAMLTEIVRLAEEADIVIPVHDQGYEPLCACYRRQTCLAAAEQLLTAGSWRLQAMLQEVRVVEYAVEKAFPGAGKRFFVNLNSRADYEDAIRQTVRDVNEVAS